MDATMFATKFRQAAEGAVPRSGWHVPAAYRVQQAKVLRARIRALATVMAILAIAWIPIDAAGLEASELARTGPLRILLAIALLRIAHGSAQLPAHGAVWLFVAAQACAFGAMQLSLDGVQGNALRVGYGLFPFLLVAQLAVFPLRWGHALALAGIALALLLLPVLLGMRAADAALLNELWLLALLTGQAAWAADVQARQLVDLLGARSDAIHDPLTGLANRRAGERALAAAHALARRTGTPYSVLMIDLDHFKAINDCYGHAGGDDVLVATAAALRGELRGNDLGIRHGGEEFLVVLPATDAGQALRVAERIRTRIGTLAVDAGAHAAPIRCTASIGIATVGDEDQQALLARADAALYRAKQRGRNRCELDEPAATL